MPTRDISTDHPMVSVCIMAYNHEKYLYRAIDSVLSQNYNFSCEVIVAEDYSSDSTLQIALGYQKSHPNKIRVVQSGLKDKLFIEGHQTGRYNFLNVLQRCRGKYITLLDGDDYWIVSDKLQRQIDHLEKHPDCSLIFHNVYLEMDDNPSSLKKCYLSQTFPGEKKLRPLLITNNYIPTSSVVFRNNIPDKFPEIFYTSMFGDWPLHIFNLNFGRPYYINEVMGVYRFGSGAWTRKKKTDQMRAILEFYDRVHDIVPEDISYLIPVAISRTNIKAAFSYLRAKNITVFCFHLIKGLWQWFLCHVKSR